MAASREKVLPPQLVGVGFLLCLMGTGLWGIVADAGAIPQQNERTHELSDCDFGSPAEPDGTGKREPTNPRRFRWAFSKITIVGSVLAVLIGVILFRPPADKMQDEPGVPVRRDRKREFDSKWKQGVANYHKNDYDKAIADLEEAILLDPNNLNASDVFYYRGLAYYHKKDYGEAIADLTEAIRLNPNNPSASDVFYNRGVAHFEKKDYDNAIADYTEAIRLNPKHAYFHNRGASYGCKSDYDKAIVDYTEAIRLDPKEAHPFYDRGRAYHHKREYGKAIADYSEAIRLAPGRYSDLKTLIEELKATSGRPK